MKLNNIVAFVFMIILLWSCGGGGSGGSDITMENTSDAMSPKMAMENRDMAGVTEDNIDLDRKIIKTGDIRFETKSLEETHKNVITALEKHKGYVAREGESSYGDRTEQNMELRIPSDHFDAFLVEITMGIKRFDYKNINTSDVTQEYIDVESRLNTRKELEKRYVEILSKAKTVTEMLEIERELNNVRSDIESMTGRLKYLSNQVSYSTLNITWYEVQVKSMGFWNKIGQGFQNGWQYLLMFIIGVINIWPFILLIAGMLLLAFWLARRKKQ